ncbi:MetQ/NlpA family ABC transporter substrate-binding protein [Fructobacillus tropaeoli]|uniref:Periplasmic component/surface antigen (NlpA) n=1 Tax=Fructobacillus tropaeoli TaxID=709323 RepID=A0ABN9YK81_9LACO|nr:MetQ/NlpA family ABC transporter substrate-binding protein [uncultured Fructobacillus sp.]CAK1223655.1 ABC-type metal ion transport system [Fructobacillus tropaeoli]CAK1237132.1 ABC-type metal ion transport system [Fructobacillus tropaeoli]CAK1239908.1 ABC-type metal ion transport system [Fructobacillus tropaeoli]
MKKRYWLTGLILILIVIAGIWSFYPHQSNSKKGTITLASSPGPYSELFLKGVKPILEKEGYTVENKSFTNLLNADIALNEGQVDLNVDQHTAYLNNFNKEKNGKLTALTKIPTVPMGLYPAQKHSLKSVSDGDTIAVPNDPSNTARAYQLLEKAGWIKLRSGVNPITATKNDIVENKYNLNFKEIDSSTIPRVTNDFSYVILPGSVAYNAKVSSKKMLVAEKIQNDYYLVATTTKKNADTKWAKAVKKAYESKEFADYVKKHNDDNYWVIPQ